MLQSISIRNKTDQHGCKSYRKALNSTISALNEDKPSIEMGLFNLPTTVYFIGEGWNKENEA